MNWYQKHSQAIVAPPPQDREEYRDIFSIGHEPEHAFYEKRKVTCDNKLWALIDGVIEVRDADAINTHSAFWEGDDDKQIRRWKGRYDNCDGNKKVSVVSPNVSIGGAIYDIPRSLVLALESAFGKDITIYPM